MRTKFGLSPQRRIKHFVYSWLDLFGDYLMPERPAYYPTTIWDGSTDNPWRNSRQDQVDPDFNDWDQISAEVIATQMGLNAVPAGPTGPTGPQGETGATGPTGPTGPSGSADIGDKIADGFCQFNKALVEDLGKRWSDLGQQFGEMLVFCFCYVGNGVVLAGTVPHAKILRSTDYGATWSDLGSQPGQMSIDNFCYLGSGVVLAGTYSGGKILRSTDYGATWSDLGQQYGQQHILTFGYAGNGIVVASTDPDNKVLRSTDYGVTWSDLGSIGANHPNEYSYLGNGVVLATMDDHIYRSIDYGATWNDLGVIFAGSTFGRLCNLGNGIVLAGVSGPGRLFRSSDYGLTWSAVYVTGGDHVQGICYLGDGLAFAASEGNIFRTVDYGETWSDLGSLFSVTQMSNLCQLGKGIILAGGMDAGQGKIYRSHVLER
jgi:photosystem II stability/assembly factor-like uncharacterized protein